MYTFEQISFNFGIAIVCTRFPLIMSLISIVSVVNAIMYGNEHTEETKKYYYKTPDVSLGRGGWDYRESTIEFSRYSSTE